MRSVFLIMVLSSFSTVVSAQSLGRVPTTINNEFEPKIKIATVDFDDAPLFSSATGTTPSGVLVWKSEIHLPDSSYSFRMDLNGDGDLSDESVFTLGNGDAHYVRAQSPSLGERSFVVSYSRGKQRSGETYEYFLWQSAYRMEGRLELGSCSQEFAVLDMNADGRFTTHEFSMGTSVSLDRNEDGVYWGRDEWLSGTQIFEFCGARFQIEDIDLSGRWIELKQTDIVLPSVGERVPEFRVKTTDGNIISGSDLAGKVFLLDFWASWCGPCIEKFPYLQKLERSHKGKLQIIAINVDEPSVVDQGLKVYETYGLTWPHVVNGLGQYDPLWRMFGSMPTVRFSIPLYVLVDSNGTIRYAESGGHELSDLENVLDQILTADSKR